MIDYDRLTKGDLVRLVEIYNTESTPKLNTEVELILNKLNEEFIGLTTNENGSVILNNDNYYIEADSLKDLRLVLTAVENGDYQCRQENEEGSTRLDINEDENGDIPKYDTV